MDLQRTGPGNPRQWGISLCARASAAAQKTGDDSRLEQGLQPDLVKTGIAGDCKDFAPSLPYRRQFQESFQILTLWTTDNKKLHSRRVRRIMKPLYKPGSNKGIQSFSDHAHFVSHKSGELLAGQECPRMSVQENEQIEITAVPHHGRMSEQSPRFFQMLAVLGCCNNFSRKGGPNRHWVDRPDTASLHRAFKDHRYLLQQT